MKRKARIQSGIDDRLVAIYARKSRITNKGDSIGVQFKQSADYAINQLSLPEDYDFAKYEDKELSGYYSDRPDFQRLLPDIDMGKIKAVACYKLDRISRKTSDLMRLLEYFERHDVTLLVCSNNINTQISTSKIIIQVLAIIAEFQRDILTERIQDNLMELAKDGRWLGGKTPTGFSSKRVTTGSGKNKSHPFAGTDKLFVFPHRNNPFADRFSGKQLRKLWIKKGGIFILNFYPVGLIIRRKAMLPVKFKWLPEQVAIMLQKIVVGIFICYTVNGIP